MFSSKNTLRRQVCRTALTTGISDTKNCVYEVPSNGCDQVYIGQTKRKLKVRLAEHRRAVVNGEQEKSGISEHCWDHNHSVDWENVKVLCREPNRLKREIKETIEMKKAGRRNYGIPTKQISAVWNPVLRMNRDVARWRGQPMRMQRNDQ